VTAYSEPRRGTLFRLYFPAVREADAAAEALVPVVPHGNGARILCVDDDATVLKAYTDMLEDLGYAVTPFEDPRLAREEFRLRPDAFDLVLTDYTMPGFSGLDLARDLHAVRPDIPVVLSSGYMATSDITAAMDAGIAAFVQKPTLHEELGMILHTALRPNGFTKSLENADGT
jgi:two-component system, cell cycle sensor histidine kinase and response regulator CckA